MDKIIELKNRLYRYQSLKESVLNTINILESFEVKLKDTITKVNEVFLVNSNSSQIENKLKESYDSIVVMKNKLKIDVLSEINNKINILYRDIKLASEGSV